MEVESQLTSTLGANQWLNFTIDMTDKIFNAFSYNQ